MSFGHVKIDMIRSVAFAICAASAANGFLVTEDHNSFYYITTPPKIPAYDWLKRGLHNPRIFSYDHVICHVEVYVITIMSTSTKKRPK